MAQGDIKGLFKYWAQNALQIALMAASFALMFIPGVGQALAAGLKFLFQGLFAAVQFVLGAAIQLLGTAISGIGSFLGNFAQGLGGFVRGIGGFISQAGSRLMTQAQTSLKEIFSNLKSAFSRVGESLKRSLGGYQPNASPLPPEARIDFGRPLPDGVKLFSQQSGDSWSKYFQAPKPLPRNSNPLQTQIEKVITDALVTIITGGKTDKQGEKGKIGSLVESLVGTVVHAGVEALKKRFLEGFSPQSLPSALIESAPVHGPPINAPIVQGSRLISPSTGNQPLLQRTLDSYGRGNYVFAYDGNGDPYQYQSSKSPYSQKLQRLSADRYRDEGESGRFIEGRFNNARPNESPRIEVIDNLKPDGLNLPKQDFFERLDRAPFGNRPQDYWDRQTIEKNLRIKLDPNDPNVFSVKQIFDDPAARERFSNRVGERTFNALFGGRRATNPNLRELQDLAGSAKGDQIYISVGPTRGIVNHINLRERNPGLIRGRAIHTGDHNPFVVDGVELYLPVQRPETHQVRVGKDGLHIHNVIYQQRGITELFVFHYDKYPTTSSTNTARHFFEEVIPFRLSVLYNKTKEFFNRIRGIFRREDDTF